MCCLFGLMDYRGHFNARQKTKILSVLSKECEARGTDATGIAYNSRNDLKIYKRPLAAHKLRLLIPDDARTVMGHTRMTTQGDEKRNYNNHPFRGIPTVPRSTAERLFGPIPIISEKRSWVSPAFTRSRLIFSPISLSSSFLLSICKTTS